MELEGKFSGRRRVGFQNLRAVELKGVKRLGGKGLCKHSEQFWKELRSPETTTGAWSGLV